MSEEKQLQVIKPDPATEERRRASWGGLGVEIYHNELLLQVKKQAIQAKLIKPETTAQIAAAEAQLAVVKREGKLLDDERKIITNKFDPPIARLMQPYKDLQAAIAQNELDIIKAKQKEKEELKTKENKEKELRDIAAKTRIYVADMHSAYLKAQLKLLTEAYENALAKEIPIDRLPTYITNVCARLTPENRATPRPKYTAQYNTEQEIEAEITKNFEPWTAQQYIDGFKIDIQNKFTDWELALKNKPQAAQINKDEALTTIAAIEDEKEKLTLITKIGSASSPLMSEEPAGKALKEVYKLTEPQTMEEADAIINAYIVHRNLCCVHMRKIIPVNFGVKQMIAALEGIKNADNKFEVTGLTFKLIDKL